MLLHLMGNEFDEETIKENYAYYEKRTLHGSSLSPSIFSVMGLKVGDDSKHIGIFAAQPLLTC